MLRLLGSGRYTVRVLRIGNRPTVLTGIDVTADSTVVLNVLLERVPISIAGMTIRDKADCTLRGRDADTFLQLWEQARVALTAAQVHGSAPLRKLHLMRIEGRVDALRYYAPESVGVPALSVDDTSFREWIADRALAMTPADTLELLGYIRRLSDGSVVYDAPSADALLDDRFLAGHCFGVVRGSAEHRDWVGIAFTPRRKRSGIVDVAGVLWLDRSTAELRRLEFTYSNVPPESHELCMVERDGKHGLCQVFAEKGLNRFGSGGHADFVRLASGEWLVGNLTLRTVSNQMIPRPSPRPIVHGYPRRECSTTDKIVRTAPRPGECTYLNWSVPQLSVVSTTLLSLTEGGNEVYSSDSSTAAARQYAQRQAGARSAMLLGSVTDDAGVPLRSAIVQTEQPSRRASLTDSLGRFSIPFLPPATTLVLVRCLGFESARVRLPLMMDSTHRVSIALPVGPGSPKTRRDCSSSE